jgi:hypothetical protein
MEKVQIEAEFKADEATKAAQAYYQNFTTAKGVLTAVNAAHKAYENTLAGQAKKLADLKKVLDHTEIGTKKYLDLQKEIAKIEKNSKPAEGMKQMGAVMTGVMQGVGQGIFSTLTGAFGRAQGAILANIPAIGQAFDMAGQIVSNNLFRPLAQEIYPIIIKIFQWISENRIVFVKLGTTIVSAFRMVWTVVSAVFNLFKAGFIKHGGVGHTGELKEERIDWEAFKKEKYGEEGIDWTRVDMGNGMQAMAKIQKPQDKLKTKTSMTGFDGDPTQSYGRSSEPQTFSEVDEDYDEQEEIELITQIKELSSVWMKTVSPEKYVMYLEGIYRVSEKLLKMHGAK